MTTKTTTLKCLIIDDMHPSISVMLEEIGILPVYRPDITKEELLTVIGEYEGIIVRSKLFFSTDIIEKATKLKFIGRAGAGLDNLDVEALMKRNIQLVNAPEGNRDAVAEQFIAMLLTMMNNIIKADKEVRAGVWDREGNRGYELMGKTVGIIGYGYMGKAVAKRLASFGCKVLAYDKYKTTYADEYAEVASLEQIQKEADIVSLHIPLTAETKFMVNEAFFDSFSKPIWFVNTARGEIVSLQGLLNALEKGKVRSAALDVLENEKIGKLSSEQQLVFNKLVASEKVLFSPHIAGWTFESYYKINETLVSKIKTILPSITK